MTTVATRTRQIAELEGFDIRVTDLQGIPVDVTQNGVLGEWDGRRKTRGTQTAQDWENKFSQKYPGYKAEIIKEDGSVAHGNTTLLTVRASYEEQD